MSALARLGPDNLEIKIDAYGEYNFFLNLTIERFPVLPDKMWLAIALGDCIVGSVGFAMFIEVASTINGESKHNWPRSMAMEVLLLLGARHAVHPWQGASFRPHIHCVRYRGANIPTSGTYTLWLVPPLRQNVGWLIY